MPTTRRRVNLTLSEVEERFLDAITTAGSPEQLAFAEYLNPADTENAAGNAAGGKTVTPSFADVVHVLLMIGIDNLEYEFARASYAAEAAEYSAEDRARIAALERNFMSVAAGRGEA